jgi:hypothetical protein
MMDSAHANVASIATTVMTAAAQAAKFGSVLLPLGLDSRKARCCRRRFRRRRGGGLFGRSGGGGAFQHWRRRRGPVLSDRLVWFAGHLRHTI